MAKPSHTFSNVMVHAVSRLSAVSPASPSCAESAMVKHPACVAASSSSGLVPFPSSNLMKRTANAQWNGDLKAGKGKISTASGVLSSTPYSFGTRFEDGKGTNPEELLAAAHAGCFTMALSAQLGLAGLTAESLETACTITFEKVGDGFAITESHL